MTKPAVYAFGSVYRRLLGYARPYLWVFVLAVLGMLLAAASNGLFVKQVEPLVESVFGSDDAHAKIWVPILIFLAITGRAIGSLIGNYGMDYVAMSVVRDIRQELFEKYLVVPSSSHDRSNTGDALGKVIFNVGMLSYSASKAVAVVIGETLTAGYLLFLMIVMSPKLVLVFLLVAPVLAVFVSLSNKAVRGFAHKIQNAMGDVAQSVGELLAAHKMMKVFGGQQTEGARFERINQYNRRQELRLSLIKSLVSPLVQIMLGLTLALIVFLAASDLIGQPMSAGEFMAFFLAMAGIFAPLRSLTTVNIEIQRGLTAAQSVFAVLDDESEHDIGTLELSPQCGDIEFKNIRFAYNADELVLDNINLTIHRGQTVALVGRSGSGKTTLASLLPRFYEPQSGEILLAGQPLTAYQLASLRRQIAYVGQDLKLFDDTLRNNIAYGELAHKSTEEIIKACEAAHAWEFIAAMPDGLNALAGDSGTLLSGGQKQRIAIARALLKDAPILILDEATSALDTQAERHIQAALNALIKDRTTLVIAHRLSTIENADLIVVMDAGKIIETGSHRDLIAANGAYAKLHAMQFGDS